MVRRMDGTDFFKCRYNYYTLNCIFLYLLKLPNISDILMVNSVLVWFGGLQTDEDVKQSIQLNIYT